MEGRDTRLSKTFLCTTLVPDSVKFRWVRRHLQFRIYRQFWRNILYSCLSDGSRHTPFNCQCFGFNFKRTFIGFKEYNYLRIWIL